MELFFTDEKFKIGNQPMVGVPFLVDSEMSLLDEINDFFLRELVPDGRTKSPKTWENYAYWLRDYLLWMEENGFDWKQATRVEVSLYRNWSSELGLKPATVNSRLTAVKRFYEWAVKEGFVEECPIKEVKGGKKKDADADYLSHTNDEDTYTRNDLFLAEGEELPVTLGKDEIKRIFLNVKHSRLKLMMAVMLECGLRRAEVVRLPNSLILELEKQAQAQGPEGGEIEMLLPAYICKNNKERTVPISYMLVMKLRQYRSTERPKFVKKYRAKHKKKEPVEFWLNRSGNPVSVGAFSTAVKDACLKAGVMGVTPHKFRHTFATELYAITGDIRLVQKLLGHSNIHTTTIYEHTAANDRHGFMEDYQKQVDNLIGGAL